MGGVRSAVAQAAVTQLSYVDRANRYIRDVLDGSLPSCKWVRLACERQQRDLLRSEQGWMYRFDIAAASRVCQFVELSPHIKGKKFAGQLIHLEDWQCFILTTVFGWLHKQTGLRRFRRVYIEIAKGNGKSALTSAVANYMAFASGEPGAEVYSAATTRDQAKIVWSVAHAMLRAMPEFCRRAGVETAAHSINQLRTNSFFRPLSSDANSAEGLQTYFTCVDELHVHPTRDLHDNLDTANGKRAGSLLWDITTAGSDQAGICYEVRGYVIKILQGVTEDESVWGIVFTIDDEDDWAAGPEIWRKANPNWGISVDPDEIAQKIKKALSVASAQPSVQTKHLNRWVNADHVWMDMVRWLKCADEKLVIEDFGGERCVVGLDLASKLDLLAKVKLFWKDVPVSVRIEACDKGPCEAKDCPNNTLRFRATDGTREWFVCETHRNEILQGNKTKRHYYVFLDCWTPEARLKGDTETQNSQYKGWVIDGYLHTCPGETNDYDLVEDDIRADCRAFEVLEVAHDPYQAQQFVNHLQPEGITMAEVPQTAAMLSQPMQDLEAAVYDRCFHFDGNPILTWAVSNVVAHRDKNDNLFPNKETYENKIDPVTALLTAMRRLMDIDTGSGSGGGVSVFAKCGRCTTVTEGQMVNGKMIFDCGKHGGKA